jgi:DNA-binding MarR family transcriptional regulator
VTFGLYTGAGEPHGALLEWSELELACVEAHANGIVVLEPPRIAPPAAVISPTLDPDELAKRLQAASVDLIRRAIRDANLNRGHLKVLANLWEKLSDKTCTAWPSRERIAAEEGLDPRTVANILYDLRRLGYLNWVRLPDPYRPRRTLLHYHWLEQEIAAAVRALRERSARPNGRGNYTAGSAYVGGTTQPVVHKTTESARPAVLSNSPSQKGNGAQAAAARPITPHLTGDGFVISAGHGLVIPVQTVSAWRERFPHVPDLEAAMQGLATTMLSKGPMHPGWTCPEGWMVGVLSKMNREAANDVEIAAARKARAVTTPSGSRNGLSSGSAIDAL